MRNVRQMGTAVCAWLALTASLALADPVSDGIVVQLREQGFRHITITRTWLGRVLILGYVDEGEREIVLNPNTGEVLRDYFRPKVEMADSDDDPSPPPDQGVGDENRPNRPDGSSRPDRNPQGGGGGTNVDVSDDGDGGTAIGDEGVPTDEPDPDTPPSQNEVKE